MADVSCKRKHRADKTDDVKGQTMQKPSENQWLENCIVFTQEWRSAVQYFGSEGMAPCILNLDTTEQVGVAVTLDLHT
jgi:hypothetical protein